MPDLQGLYVIVDADCIGTEEIHSATHEVLSAGVKIIQYRDKINNQNKRFNIAKQLRELTQQYSCILIINDDIKLTKMVEADGVHLGKHDDSIVKARKKLGNYKIIGASCYNNYENAQQAINASADYIAFGSFYPSSTKPNALKANLELLKRAKQDFDLPICAIGGISHKNVPELMKAGADMIAVISSIFNTSSPMQAVQEYLSIIQAENTKSS